MTLHHQSHAVMRGAGMTKMGNKSAMFDDYGQ